MNKIKRSAQVALCGMMAALCMLLMFMTGLIPFATYAIPALAGILMIVIVVETNAKWALLVYIAVSLLSIFITPDREAAMMFIAFFGHYPILKLYLERVRPRAQAVAPVRDRVDVIAVGAQRAHRLTDRRARHTQFFAHLLAGEIPLRLREQEQNIVPQHEITLLLIFFWCQFSRWLPNCKAFFKNG